MDRHAKLKKLEELHAKVLELESELAEDETAVSWPPREYYTGYYATTGFLLGFLAACTSLLLNVIGSVYWPQVSGQPQHPLRIIQVYLTFPLGEAALKIDSGIVLAIGCVLYLGTGMVYGILFQIVLTRFFPMAGIVKRLLITSVLALLVWVVNFYFLLAWLQPLLVGGNWILELVPWWVAALTHLVFGWTMALVYPLGLFIPYRAGMEGR